MKAIYKPLEIEYRQFLGNNWTEIESWSKGRVLVKKSFQLDITNSNVHMNILGEVFPFNQTEFIARVDIGDYIITEDGINFKKLGTKDFENRFTKL